MWSRQKKKKKIERFVHLSEWVRRSLENIRKECQRSLCDQLFNQIVCQLFFFSLLFSIEIFSQVYYFVIYCQPFDCDITIWRSPKISILTKKRIVIENRWSKQMISKKEKTKLYRCMRCVRIRLRHGVKTKRRIVRLFYSFFLFLKKERMAIMFGQLN